MGRPAKEIHRNMHGVDLGARDKCARRFIVVIKGLNAEGQQILFRLFDDVSLRTIAKRMLRIDTQLVTRDGSRRGRPCFDWNDEVDAILRQFYKTVGPSELSRTLSAKFKRSITKNMVIGRAHRLGLLQKKDVNHDGL